MKFGTEPTRRYDPAIDEYGRHALRRRFTKQCQDQGLVVCLRKWKDGAHFARCRPQLLIQQSQVDHVRRRTATRPTGFFVVSRVDA